MQNCLGSFKIVLSINLIAKINNVQMWRGQFTYYSLAKDISTETIFKFVFVSVYIIPLFSMLELKKWFWHFYFI